MFRVFRQVGGDGTMLDLVYAEQPAEAEAAYFRLCQVRTEGSGRVCVRPAPGLEVAVPRGSFRTNRQWTGAREEEQERWLQCWARPDEGAARPSPFQVRGAAKAAGLTGTRAADLLGVDSRTWRYWCNEGSRTIPWTAWFALLVLGGLHPDFCFDGASWR